MKTTIQERKEKAVELMKQLQIYKPYINNFKKDTYAIGLFKMKNLTTRLNNLKKNMTLLSTQQLTNFASLDNAAAFYTYQTIKNIEIIYQEQLCSVIFI